MFFGFYVEASMREQSRNFPASLELPSITGIRNFFSHPHLEISFDGGAWRDA
jgi:hypothetical protein